MEQGEDKYATHPYISSVPGQKDFIQKLDMISYLCSYI